MHGRRAKALLAPLVEQIGEVHEWPRWAVTLALEPAHTSKQRYTFTNFLLGNRVPPIIIAEFMIPKLRDRSACADVAGLMRAFWQGDLRQKAYRKAEYWDVTLKTSLPLSLMSGTVVDAEFWVPAMAMMNKAGEIKQQGARLGLQKSAATRFEEDRMRAFVLVVMRGCCGVPR